MSGSLGSRYMGQDLRFLPGSVTDGPIASVSLPLTKRETSRKLT